MNEIKHWSIALGSLAVAAAVFALAPAALAAPSPAIDFTYTFSEDTGIVCGSGANTFDVINTATVHLYGTNFFDKNGNFVKDVLYRDTNGTFSNSVTGASIPYKARTIEHDSLATPGDFKSTFTAITTGEMQVIAPGSGVVWHQVLLQLGSRDTDSRVEPLNRWRSRSGRAASSPPREPRRREESERTDPCAGQKSRPGRRGTGGRLLLRVRLSGHHPDDCQPLRGHRRSMVARPQTRRLGRPD